MSDWIQLTEADLLTVISGGELNAFRKPAKAAGQVDPVQPALDQVSLTVRGYVAGCDRNQLDANAQKIPPELKSAALDLLVPEIQTRAGGTFIDPESQRAKAAAEAMRILRDVSRCSFAISQPTGTIDTGIQSGAAGEMVNTPTRKYDGSKLNGL